MTRAHLRAWGAVTLEYMPLALTCGGVLVALFVWHTWPTLTRAYPLLVATIVLSALCLGLAISLVHTRRALHRGYLCGGPLATDGLWICPVLATGRPFEGQSLPGVRQVAVYGTDQSAHAQPPVRVLVVEDDAVTRYIMVRVLEQAGFQVEASADGGQALYILGHERPDVMVLDLVLPTLTGAQVARAQQRLKEEFGHTTRIVVVTIHTEAEAEAKSFGADAFLVKPVDSALLVRTVAQLARPPEEEEHNDPDAHCAEPHA